MGQGGLYPRCILTSFTKLKNQAKILPYPFSVNLSLMLSMMKTDNKLEQLSNFSKGAKQLQRQIKTLSRDRLRLNSGSNKILKTLLESTKGPNTQAIRCQLLDLTSSTSCLLQSDFSSSKLSMCSIWAMLSYKVFLQSALTARSIPSYP